MGNAEWGSNAYVLNRPLFENIRLEESKEDTFHFHWKDMRIEMVRPAFYILYRSMRAAYSNIHSKSTEDNPLIISLPIANPVDESLVKVERIAGGNLHLHYRDLRLELTREDLLKLKAALEEL